MSKKIFHVNTLFQTDKQRVQLYLAENAGWLKTIVTQADEIPVFKKMLNNSIMAEDDYKTGIEKDLFDKEFSLQEEEMTKLNTALHQQQKRLKTDEVKKYLYDIDSLCSQDILRDRIKEIEKKYIELKCNFMKFLASTL